MRKQSIYYYVLSILLLIATCCFSVFAFSMISYVVVNYEAISKTMLATLPAIFFLAFLVSFCVLDFNELKEKTDSERIYDRRRFLILTMIYSGLGLISSIITGTVVYGTFVGSHPFGGYALVFTILFSLMIAGAVLLYVLYYKKVQPTDSHVKNNAKAIWCKIGGVIYFVYAAYRAGQFILLPLYTTTKVFFTFFYFYISLLIPMAFVILYILYHLNRQNHDVRKARNIVSLSFLMLSICIITGCVITNFTNGITFITALTPLFKIERLIKLPVDFLVHSLMIFVPTVVGVCNWKRQ